MQQYHDDIHYRGYQEFASFLLQHFKGPRMTIIGGVGSGCSTGAVAQYLRAAGVEVSLHGIQPFGSVTFHSEHVEDPGIIIAGIGSAIPFKNVRPEVYDHIHWISFNYSSAGAVGLLKDHGIFAGLSTGACYTVGKWCRQQTIDEPCLFMGADMGHRYLGSVFQEARMDWAKSLSPNVISNINHIQMPWSTLHWNRRTAWQAEAIDAHEFASVVNV
jgi:cysteine synthase A